MYWFVAGLVSQSVIPCNEIGTTVCLLPDLQVLAHPFSSTKCALLFVLCNFIILCDFTCGVWTHHQLSVGAGASPGFFSTEAKL